MKTGSKTRELWKDPVFRAKMLAARNRRPKIRDLNNMPLIERRFYNVWQSAKKRCNNPNDAGYVNYGSRGIKCLWETYEAFKHDMWASYNAHRETYPDDTSIDRINNDGHYTKPNCRWATWSEQQVNRRRPTHCKRGHLLLAERKGKGCQPCKKITNKLLRSPVR